MSRARFLDCAAAHVIARVGKSLPDGHRPVLRHAAPSVLRLIELTGLDIHCAVEP